jgi:prepilin-type processing-associated H-X9-DG protein
MSVWRDERKLFTARRSSCSNNLKQWGLAMHTFHDGNGKFPLGIHRKEPDDIERRTWVVFLWPYIEAGTLAEAFDYTKDSHHAAKNRGLTTQKLPVYYCPSDRPSAAPASTTSMAKLNYLVNWGRSTLYDSTQPARHSPFGLLSGTQWYSFVSYQSSMKDVTDGLSKTLLFAECAFADVDADTRGSAFSDLGTPGFMTLYPPNNGTDAVTTCSNEPAMPCVQVNGTSPNTYNKIFVTARSKHPGGVMTAMCDGSVRFVTDTVEPVTWKSLSTSNLGETLGDF